MTILPDIQTNPVTAPNTNSEFRRVVRVLLSRWTSVFSFVIILVVIILAILAPLIAPYDPYKPDPVHTLDKPSVHHLLGTDAMGRDVLSRLIYGSRISLVIGLIATGIAAVAGLLLGLLAGYFSGWVNTVIMRFMDALMAFPVIVLALLIATLLGGGLTNLMVAIGIAMSAMYARVTCGVVLGIKENDYIMALKSIGASHMRIMLRHIATNAFPSIIVLVTINMGAAILAEAGLSYLGIGVQPPIATWGSMVKSGYSYLLSSPILALVPGIAIFLLVYAFNTVGDSLRDALDPKLRGLV
jgi:peptide/nickel transport system permease protein